MNKQPVEKRVDLPHDRSLSVHSIFHTIQGEGPFTGTPAIFVRLAGCNLQCPGCDTDYTGGRRDFTVNDIIEKLGLITPTTRLIVITGGEPFRQNLTELLFALVRRGYYVQIETNGSFAPPALVYSTRTNDQEGVYIVCSPKTGSIHKDIERSACAFKYVMHADSVDPNDGLPILALGHSARPRVARPPLGNIRPVYLQPMDEYNPKSNERHVQACVLSCMKYGYNLQLQLHKILRME